VKIAKSSLLTAKLNISVVISKFFSDYFFNNTKFKKITQRSLPLCVEKQRVDVVI